LAEPDLSAFGIDGARVVAGHVELAPAERQLHPDAAGRGLARLALRPHHFGVGYRFEPEPVGAAA
jgi:hypothetical protein